jgi:hypothetical protein
MELRELLAALHKEMDAAGVSAKGAAVSLAFVAHSKRGRDGIEVDFVDAAAMSKPHPEEIHRLKLSLANPPQQVSSIAPDGDAEEPKTDEQHDRPRDFRKGGKPSSLPPKRKR